jgi:hypothetical protein
MYRRCERQSLAYEVIVPVLIFILGICAAWRGAIEGWLHRLEPNTASGQHAALSLAILDLLFLNQVRDHQMESLLAFRHLRQ